MITHKNQWNELFQGKIMGRIDLAILKVNKSTNRELKFLQNI